MLWLRDLKSNVQEPKEAFTIILSRAAVGSSTHTFSRIPRRKEGNKEHVTAPWLHHRNTMSKYVTFSRQVSVVLLFGLKFCSRSTVVLLKAPQLLTLRVPPSTRAHPPFYHCTL